MLLNRQRRRPAKPRLHMASMVDVVFLLLIFFMCTSSFDEVEHSLDSRLPRAGQSERTEDLPPIRITVEKVPDGVLVSCEGQVFATFEGLVKRLREWRAIDDIQIIIEGKGTVPFGYMVAALDACYQADLRRVAFSAAGRRP